MTERPRIIITQRVVTHTDRGETRDCLDQAWTVWLNLIGFDCLPVPNRCTSIEALARSLRPAGIILSGGNNLTLDVYDEAAASGQPGDACAYRDDLERRLVEFAVAERVPLLGCCRGMQFLVAHFGGRLIRVGGVNREHVARDHEIAIREERFGRLAGGPLLMVNSFHEFGVSFESLPAALSPFAVATSDDTVEGCYHKERPIVGIMWHPERRNLAADFDRRLVSSLFGAQDRSRGRDALIAGGRTS